MSTDSDTIHLRPILEKDVDALLCLNDWGIASQIIGLPYPFYHQHARWLCENVKDAWSDGVPTMVAIALKETDRMIGGIGLELLADAGDNPSRKKRSIGFWIEPKSRGHDYTVQALKQLVAGLFGHTAIDELTAVTKPDNTVSQRILAKAGFNSRGLMPSPVPTRLGSTVAFFVCSKSEYHLQP